MQAVLVLIVEDDPLIQMDIDSTLQDAGYATKSASSGEAAIKLLEAQPEVKALVTDINLAGKLMGWELAKRARELTPDLPIVYVTSEHGGEWTSSGVPGSILIQKPFASAQLITAVSQLLLVSSQHPAT